MNIRTRFATSFNKPVLSLMLLILVGLAQPAFAQISINIGVSQVKAKRLLVKQGYSQIEFYQLGFSSLKATACKNGIRHKLKIDSSLRTKRIGEAGRCKQFFTIEQARAFLHNDGYRRIDINEQNGSFVAVGCKGNKRFRITLTRFGEVTKRRRTGDCRNFLEPSDVAALLKEKGFDRIQFTDRQLPKYVAEVCKDTRKLEIVISGRGKLLDKRRIGRCNPQINPANIAAVLRELGYDRIQVFDDQLPQYMAEVCKRGERIEVTLNRYGTITNQIQLGECAPPITKSRITGYLQEQGFTRIVVRNVDDNFNISACYDNQKNLIVLSKYGELINQTEAGDCVTRSMADIKHTLSGRGMYDIEFFVEACRNRRLVRIQYNEYGERIGRKIVGSC